MSSPNSRMERANFALPLTATLGMLTRVVIKVLAIVAVTLLSAVAAMLLLSQAYGSREYASMVIWCSIAVGVIGGCMVAGSVVLPRSNDVHLRLTVYPMRPDLEDATGRKESGAHCGDCSCSFLRS